jgi:hypothetical protein
MGSGPTRHVDWRLLHRTSIMREEMKKRLRPLGRTSAPLRSLIERGAHHRCLPSVRHGLPDGHADDTNVQN